MEQRGRTHGLGALTALVVLCLAVPTAGLAQGECQADASVDLMHEEPSSGVTHLQFQVEIGTSERCAQIEYDLVLEKQLANGQTKRVRIPRRVKLNDGRFTETVRYSMSSDMRLLSYHAKIHSCQTCDMMR